MMTENEEEIRRDEREKVAQAIGRGEWDDMFARSVRGAMAGMARLIAEEIEHLTLFDASANSLADAAESVRMRAVAVADGHAHRLG